MTQSKSPQARFRVAHLNPRQPTEFALSPDAQSRQALAAELGLTDLPKLRFSGQIRAVASDGWQVTGQLAARVVQPCVVTLAPVATDLQEEVRRVFSPHATTPEGDEAEMPDDDTEPLGQYIDLDAIMAEELSLALPLYPRARNATLSEPEPDSAETRKPFAGLADLLKDSKNQG